MFELNRPNQFVVDISKYNGTIDFKTAKKHVGYFIARTGDGTGSFGRDPYYKQHVDSMKREGISFGNYMFNRFTSVQSAINEARYMWEFGDKQATSWVCDAEVSTAPNMRECIQAFCDELRRLGAPKVGLYIGHHKYKEFQGHLVKNIDFVWIPRYGAKPSFDCDLWQFTETGNVPGIGKCDINILMGNKTIDFYTSHDERVNIIVNKYNKVVTYEFGVNLVPDMIQMMDTIGYVSRIVSNGDKQGLVRFETDYRQGNELDKATVYLDSRGLKYYYTKE